MILARKPATTVRRPKAGARHARLGTVRGKVKAAPVGAGDVAAWTDHGGQDRRCKGGARKAEIWPLKTPVGGVAVRNGGIHLSTGGFNLCVVEVWVQFGQGEPAACQRHGIKRRLAPIRAAGQRLWERISPLSLPSALGLPDIACLSFGLAAYNGLHPVVDLGWSDKSDSGCLLMLSLPRAGNRPGLRSYRPRYKKNTYPAMSKAKT